jgi:hypothetical protein
MTFVGCCSYDNPLPTLTTPFRQLSLFVVWTLNLRQLIYPANLSCDWSTSSVQLVPSFEQIGKVCPSAAFALLFALLSLKLWQNKTLFFVSFVCLLPLILDD